MSGRKNCIKSYKLLDAKALTATFQSDPVNINFLDNVSIQLIVTCSANNGTFTIEVSNDGLNWNTLSLSPAIAALASANTNIFVNIQQLAAAWIRVVFTQGATHTDGVVNGFIVAKEL